MNGVGTLVFIVVTKGKAPAYLGFNKLLIMCKRMIDLETLETRVSQKDSASYCRIPENGYNVVNQRWREVGHGHQLHPGKYYK